MSSLPDQLAVQIKEIHISSTDSLYSKGIEQRRKSVAYKFQDPKQLLMAVSAVVKNRTGSVLTRQMILKSDHFDTGIDAKLDIHLHGAPNFRMADMNIFGVAQPTISGIRTILTLLRCSPGTSYPSPPAVWVNAREEPVIYINRKPFVIRDAKQPLRNINTYQGIMANRLEQMEERLREDILLELHRWNGLVLVHEERSDSTIVPVWINADDVQTPRQVYESLKQQGFLVEYARIPISPEQPPQYKHTEHFVNVVRNASNQAPLIFNCGMGLGRTTCAMVMAMLIRRSEMVLKEEGDPFPVHSGKNQLQDTGTPHKVVELMQLLNDAFSGSSANRSAIEWMMARSPLLGDLMEGMNGKYRSVIQLMTMLDLGSDAKWILDTAIDRCAILMNIRNGILALRIRYSLSGDDSALSKALGCLERYLALLTLCSYLQDQIVSKSKVSYTQWLDSKPGFWYLCRYIFVVVESSACFPHTICISTL
jgi:predicted protein tyrosine phosphatase